MIDSEQDLLLALAASPNFKKDKLVFAGRRSGLYGSRDAGKSWEPVSIVQGKSLSVTALAFSPNFIRDRFVFAAVPGGVAYSQDAGDTWFWTQLSTPAPYVTALVVSPNFSEDKTLFAATLEDGILCSINDGISWDSWNFGLLDKQVLCLVVNYESVFAGTGTGLFCSHNRGRSWREMTLPVDVSILSLAITDTRLLAGTEEHGLFTSVDNGETWKRIKAKGLDMPINQIQATGGKDASMRVLVGATLIESADEGRIWQGIQLPQDDDAPVLLSSSLVGFASGRVLGY